MNYEVNWVDLKGLALSISVEMSSKIHVQRQLFVQSVRQRNTWKPAILLSIQRCAAVSGTLLYKRLPICQSPFAIWRFSRVDIGVCVSSCIVPTSTPHYAAPARTHTDDIPEACCAYTLGSSDLERHKVLKEMKNLPRLLWQ